MPLLAAICYDGNEGLYWVGITQFVIVVFAMVILTLRVAFKESHIPDDELEVGPSEAPEGASDALAEDAVSASEGLSSPLGQRR
jgi:hypothetical protein